MSNARSNREIASTMTTVAGVAAAVAVLSSVRTAKAITPALKYSDIPGTGDVKVLNYALALEQLEADLYAQALLRLQGGGTNGVGKTIPGLNVASTERDVVLIKAFAVVEVQHRDFLTAALKAAAIKPFKYDFAIETKSRQQVLDLVILAEQTGVGAYLGAISLLATRQYLQIAGAIQGTEARHTAVLSEAANLLFNEGLNVAPPASSNNGRDLPVDPDTVLGSVSPFIVA